MLHTRARARAQIPTSSMADIAFLLLVFFLVTTVFDEEKGLPIMLPQGELEVADENVLHLTAHADGRVAIRHGAAPNVRWTIPSAIGGIWWDAVARRPGLIAALHTPPEASYGRMVDVLDALQEAGATRISLQVAESARGR
jgi:biopolymer transport protein ExbD